MSELETQDLPILVQGFKGFEGIQRLREIGILEWICHLRLSYPPWVHPEAIFTTTMRNRFMWGAPAS